jgi:hypothetical protein
MKIAVMILGILGALAVGGLGAKWVSDYEKNKETIVAMTKLAHSFGGGKTTDVDDAIKGVERTKTAGYIMIVGGLLALAAAIAVGKLGKISAAVMLVAAIAPAVLAPLSLVASFLLILAGILAFFVKTKPAARYAGATRLAA